ncbi:hypothetical protein EYS14_13160 [Alteromonadaceae bacterium M269]|nr:hypothetical protein EYS14_13160 [Alteromonadaceae bacterium M269]
MKCKLTFAGLIISFLAGCALNSTEKQSDETTLSKYQRAEQFLPISLRDKAHNLWVRPRWQNNGTFWFALKNGQSTDYIYYDENHRPHSLFNLDKLANSLNVSDKESFEKELDVVNGDEKSIHIRWQKKEWSCDKSNTYQCREVSSDTGNTAPLISPNGKWQAFVKEYNLFLRDLETGKEHQLTTDGQKDFAYATANSNPRRFFNKPKGSVEHQKVVYWADNSKYLVTFQLDLRKVGKLHLTQSVTGKGHRPRTYEYHYPLAGDKHIPQGHIVLVDVSKKEAFKIDNPTQMQTYYGDPLWGGFEDNNKFYFVERERGFQTYRLKELSPQTRRVKTLIEETNSKYIDPWAQRHYVFPDENTLLWTSERHGVQQVFRYDLVTGELINEVTPTDLIVRDIKSVDAKEGQLYFEGAALDQAEPYYRHLYSVNFTGKDLKLLTPEPQMHSTQLSPSYDVFIDTMSTVQSPPVHTLRRLEDGKMLAQLGQANTDELDHLGYKPPEPFNLLTEDGKTRLFGVLYYPSNFDPNQQYPIIDDVYTGPHGYFTPKTYGAPLGAHAQALAELGFIVIKMDGRGTAKRDRAFHEYSYKNLSGGVDDHVWAIKQLAQKYRYIDIDRVGIYGFSAGGYDTAHAMFKYPDFFKVGVSASGNHDFRTDKTGWNETWMGYPVGSHWDEQSNLNLVDKLKGKLLLAHGELDDNVNPAATMQLVDSLIKANKDFELMLYPNMGHLLHRHPYFVRKRWDFFVKHLLEQTPPPQFVIRNMEVPR